ncbi:50S ribosomal protein L29 [Rothia sp. AR01]|uniref:Large ribosomal subunit protein uL29 n=1 Tax=Rothia santali TaxID=2949643 RepID=A0A9X2HDL7_9MICC|nr:50S ribosomal protein L29 [Rothia santali]MCP3424922.1 50S ribosomal protein L29 [Rothia santali]
MAVGSKDLSLEQLEELDNNALVEKLRSSKEELFNLRFQKATGQLQNSGRFQAVKRDIARIYTVMRERELGIRPEAEVAEVEASDKKADKKAAKAAKKAEKANATEGDAK